MAGFDNNGNYTRNFSWQVEDANGKGIVSDDHDTEDNEFALGLNQAFLRNGSAQATGTWDMAGHVIGGLGTRNPTPADNDAVTYGQLTGSTAAGTPAFNKGINIAGADLNGRVTFSSLTGANGLSWTGADMSFLARIHETTPTKTRDRLVVNSTAAGTVGADTTIIDDAGNINMSSFTYNLSLDSLNQWRTIGPGWAGRAFWDGAGCLNLQNLDAATVTDPYLVANLKTRVTFTTNSGYARLDLHKSSTASSCYAAIAGYRDDNLRWLLQLGSAHAESPANSGSDFYINKYNDAGAGTPVFWITRSDGKVHMPNVASGVSIDGDINSPSSALVLGGVPGVYLRPNGIASASGQLYVPNTGFVQMTGIAEHQGTNGGFGSNTYNFLYVSNSDNRCYVGGSTGLVGTWVPACDYRIKRDVAPLPGCWDAVKKLRPIVYREAAWGDPEVSPFRDRDQLECGFLAHELQEALGPFAASGEKDGPDIQSPKLIAIIAGLTSALQEAQLRIESLEAKLA